MTRPAKQPTEYQQNCPHWCAKPHLGQHAHEVGVSKFGDEVRVTLSVDRSTAAVDVFRDVGADLRALTATQAYALADLLVDGSHSDGQLIDLLYRAGDLITKPPKPPKRSARFRIFRWRGAA